MSEILFSVNDGIDALLWYHYAAMGAVVALFLFLLFLGIVFFKKKLLAAVLFLFAFLILTAGIPLGLVAVEAKVRDIEVSDLNVTRLVYSPVVVVTGIVKNEALMPTQTIYYKVRITRVSDNWFLDIKNYLQPLVVQTFKEDLELDQNESVPFELLIDYGDKKIPKYFNTYISYKAL